MNANQRKLLLIVVFIMISIGLSMYLNQSGIFTFEELLRQKESLAAFVAENYLLTVFIFIGIYYVSTTFSIPIAIVLSLAGGFLFGPVQGTLFNTIAATAGATTLFLLSRYLMGDYLQGRYADRLKTINAEFDRHGQYYFLTMRLVPLFPFFLVNLVGGLSKLRLSTFVWTTALGIIPGTFIYAYAGDNISRINSVQDVFSREMFIALTMLGLLSLVPIVWKRFRDRQA